MKIWLDDIRDAPDDSWTVVRTPQDVIRELVWASTFDVPVEVLSLDHDLGDDYFTGYYLTNAMEEMAAHGEWNLIPQRFQIHSANPVGRKNMQAAIDSIERMRNETSV